MRTLLVFLCIIFNLPDGLAQAKTYYVCNGTFYIKPQGKSGYLVVTPPFGIEVPDLPKEAVAVKVEGKTYYQYDLVYYRKVTDAGKTSYVIVASPFKK